MVELLIPADAEVAAVAALGYLGTAADVAGVKVGTRIPNPAPADFLRILTSGGAGRDLVTGRHLITVEAFSTDEGRAQRLCTYAVAILEACARTGRMGATICYRVEVGGLPANLPFPALPTHHRFTSTISADLRKTAA